MSRAMELDKWSLVRQYSLIGTPFGGTGTLGQGGILYALRSDGIPPPFLWPETRNKAVIKMKFCKSVLFGNAGSGEYFKFGVWRETSTLIGGSTDAKHPDRGLGRKGKNCC